MQTCPFVHWSPWTPWSSCSKSCNTGTTTRTRSCPRGSVCSDMEGLLLSNTTSETTNCNTDPCPHGCCPTVRVSGTADTRNGHMPRHDSVNQVYALTSKIRNGRPIYIDDHGHEISYDLSSYHGSTTGSWNIGYSDVGLDGYVRISTNGNTICPTDVNQWKQQYRANVNPHVSCVGM